MQSEQPWYIAAELAQLPFPLAAKAWLETRRAYISPKTFHEYEINIKMLSTFFGRCACRKSMAIRSGRINACARRSAGPLASIMSADCYAR